MQSFDIVTLRVFLAVSRCGSIGGAARQEHIAASAVSRRLSDLERDMAVTLLTRGAQGVKLTAAGRAFAQHCERLLGAYAEVRVDLKRFSDGAAGVLRISAINSALNGSLPAHVARFQRENPDVEVQLTEIFSQDGTRYLREDLADVVIISDTMNTKGFQTQSFAPDPLWVMGHADLPLFQDIAAGQPVPFKATLDYEMISFREGGALDEIIAKALKAEGRPYDPVVRVMRVDALRMCAAAGLGVGYIRERSLKPYLGAFPLGAAPLCDEWAQRHLVYVSAQAGMRVPTVDYFIETVKAYESESV